MEPISLLTTLDQNYLPQLQVMLTSLAVNNEGEAFHLILLHSAISEKGLSAIRQQCAAYGCSLLPIHADWNIQEMVHGDSGYLGAEKREGATVRNKQGKKKIRYKINRRPSQGKHSSTRSRAQIKCREREKSSVRAKVEHVFAVVKNQFRYRKTRCSGLRKQVAKLNIMFALANLILADRPGLTA